MYIVHCTALATPMTYNVKSMRARGICINAITDICDVENNGDEHTFCCVVIHLKSPECNELKQFDLVDNKKKTDNNK